MAKGTGWLRDLPDVRDELFAYSPRPATLKALPAAVDLRPGCPPVYDQGSLGSCTAQAVAACIQFTEKELVAPGTKRPVPSRLFIYYNTRQLHNTVQSDSGASIRNSVKAVARWGYCQEALWKHVIKDFTKKPAAEAYKAAAEHRLLKPMYNAVERKVDTIKAASAEYNPMTFGFPVYEDAIAYAGKNGVLNPPARGDDQVGGHAVVIVGYNENGVWCRNSWGGKWGIEGYFLMSWEYFTAKNLASDIWVIKMVPAIEEAA